MTLLMDLKDGWKEVLKKVDIEDRNTFKSVPEDYITKNVKLSTGHVTAALLCTSDQTACMTDRRVEEVPALQVPQQGPLRVERNEVELRQET